MWREYEDNQQGDYEKENEDEEREGHEISFNDKFTESTVFSESTTSGSRQRNLSLKSGIQVIGGSLLPPNVRYNG